MSRLLGFGSHHPRLLSLITFLLSAAIAAGLIWRAEENRVQERRAAALLSAADVANSIEESVQQNLTVASLLAALVRQGRGTVPGFEQLAAALLPSFPGVSPVELAPDGIIRNIAPLSGNEAALGLNLLQDPSQKAEAILARDSAKLTLAGPLNLVQGGLGLVGRQPVFLDDAEGKPVFWGFTLAVIRIERLLHGVHLPALEQQGYAYQLWRIRPEDGARQIIAASPHAVPSDPVEHVAALPNANWTLSIAPVKGWHAPMALSVDVIFGLLLSLLLAYIVELIIALADSRKGLETQVAERTRELAESEARYRSLFAGSSVVMLLIDPDGGAILDANAAACAYYGWDLATLKSMRISDINTLSPQQVQAEMQQAVSAQKGYFEFRHRLASGEVREVEVFSGRVDVLGRKQLLSVVHDVTERLKSKRELAESEDRFRGLVEQSIAGIFILQDGKVAYANPRCAEIGGYESAEEMVGRDPVSLFVAVADRGMVAEAMHRLFAGEVQSTALQYSGLRRDGSVIQVGAHATRAFHKGRPAILGMVQDISEKKRAEDEIKHYVAQLETAFMSTVEVATNLGEMRDPYTAGHQRRVAEIAVAIGAELGLDQRRLEGLRVVGYLHDVGKINIPAEILSKPGKLSAIELQLIQGHSQAGYEVLKDVKFPWPVAEVALQHHERMDGSGYPRGLKGEAILLEARIIAVADVVEAMSSHRPYRAGLGIDKTLAEIERGRGSVYDANVADACLRLFREKGYAIPA